MITLRKHQQPAVNNQQQKQKAKAKEAVTAKANSIMNALQQLKAACVPKYFKSFKDLVPGEYIVNKFSLVDTTHGKRVRIDMDNGSTFMYLPPRFDFNEATIAEMNSAPKIMIYGGKDGRSVTSRLILDFEDVSYLSDQFLA